MPRLGSPEGNRFPLADLGGRHPVEVRQHQGPALLGAQARQGQAEPASGICAHGGALGRHLVAREAEIDEIVGIGRDGPVHAQHVDCEVAGDG